MTYMDQIHMDATDRSAVPWWAAFGAPLVGVPLLIGLLALGSPEPPEDVVEPAGDAALTSEQVERAPAEAPEWMAEVSGRTVPGSPSRC